MTPKLIKCSVSVKSVIEKDEKHEEGTMSAYKKTRHTSLSSTVSIAYVVLIGVVSIVLCVAMHLPRDGS